MINMKKYHNCDSKFKPNFKLDLNEILSTKLEYKDFSLKEFLKKSNNLQLNTNIVYVIIDNQNDPVNSLKKYDDKKKLNREYITKPNRKIINSKCLYVGRALKNSLVKRIKNHTDANTSSPPWSMKLKAWYGRDIRNISIRLYYFVNNAQDANEIIYLEACIHDHYKPIFGKK